MIDERLPGEGMPESFLELPALLYRDDPMWIPEDSEAVEAAFAPTNPWLEQGEAVMLSVPDESRMALFFQPDLRIEGRSIAFFGYWETHGETYSDRILFDRAVEWARQRGAQDLYGPINFTTFGNYRLRLTVEPDGRTFPDEPYNPSIYPQILEGESFTIDQMYLTQVGHIELGRVVREMKRPAQQDLLARGYKLKTLTHALWMDSLPKLHGLVDSIFGANFAYTPLSYDAFVVKCGEGFICRACPETSVLCEAPDGSVAGFFLVYPHYGPLVVQGAGDGRVPVSELNFQEHYPLLAGRDWRGAVAKTVGVSPDHRRMGVMDALTVAIFERGDDRYIHWYGAMIRRGNPSRKFAQGNTSSERWYGLFRRRLSY